MPDLHLPEIIPESASFLAGTPAKDILILILIVACIAEGFAIIALFRFVLSLVERLTPALAKIEPLLSSVLSELRDRSGP